MSTSIANSSIIALTSFSVALLPSIDHLLPLLSELMVLRTVKMSFDLKRSTSVYDSKPSLPCLTNCARSGDLPVSRKGHRYHITDEIMEACFRRLPGPTFVTEKMLIEPISLIHPISGIERRQRHNIWRNLPTVAGLPQHARQIAWVTVDFPVPFGPRITFKRGPGNTSQSSKVRKLCILTLKTEPFPYPFFFRRATFPLPEEYSAGISLLSPMAGVKKKIQCFSNTRDNLMNS